MDIELDSALPLVEDVGHSANGLLSRPLSTSQAWSLFTSHALSTWNARTYEFAAILFTASAFPDTLLASSLRGLCTTLAALCFSSSIGNWIDTSPSRIRTLLVTISANRCSVILACLGWFLLVQKTDTVGGAGVERTLFPKDEMVGAMAIKSGLFAFVVSLGVCEKLSGIGNMITMERDWVPNLACTSTSQGDHIYSLTHLNAVMRRIDLICKLVSPLVISVIISATSMPAGVVTVAGMSGISWGFEVFCARRVWRSCPRLRASKAVDLVPNTTPTDRPNLGRLHAIRAQSQRLCRSHLTQLRNYVSTDVWVPSISLAMLHLSVLSYSATFITFLLNSGFSLIVITIARAIGSIVEVSSTFVAPAGIGYLAVAKGDARIVEDQEELLDDEEQRSRKQHAVGLARSGLWGITLQLANLVPVVLAIFYLHQPGPSSLLSRFLSLHSQFSSRLLTTIMMFTFLSISRLGLWVFDLTTQEITQTQVRPDQRSSFAGTEMGFISLFELAQWVISAIVSHPNDFRWLALGSLGAVLCSTAMYAYWVKRQRGHLTHWDRIGKSCFHPTTGN